MLKIGQVINLNSGGSTVVTFFDDEHPGSTMPWQTCDDMWRMNDGTAPCGGWVNQPIGMTDPDEFEYDYA